MAPAKFAQLKPSFFNALTGAANRTRTCDPVITNDVLYQLSYCGGPSGFAFGNGLKTPAPDIGQRPIWQEKRCLAACEFASKRNKKAAPAAGLAHWFREIIAETTSRLISSSEIQPSHLIEGRRDRRTRRRKVSVISSSTDGFTQRRTTVSNSSYTPSS
jgi:hypothetical protein